MINTLRTARKGVHTGPTASTPARALEKKKKYVCDPMRMLISTLDLSPGNFHFHALLNFGHTGDNSSSPQRLAGAKR